MAWKHRKGGHESAKTRKKVSASAHRHPHKAKARRAGRHSAVHHMKTHSKAAHHKTTKSEVIDTAAYGGLP